MKRSSRILRLLGLSAVMLFLVLSGAAARESRAEEAPKEPAANSPVIKTGVYAGEIDLSGMTEAEAVQAVNAYINNLKSAQITLLTGDNQQIAATAGELGLFWSNPELVSEALALGSSGNVIERYKAIKDLEHTKKVFPIEYNFSVSDINAFLINTCSKYDKEAVNGSLKRENGVFQYTEGQPGYRLDVEKSIDAIYDFLTNGWSGGAGTVELIVQSVQPKGTEEELSQVKDLLGSFTTSFASSDADRSANVTNGCHFVNGTLLYPGEEFSTYNTVSPLTAENGYFKGGAYLNGQVVDSIGGGICQVSTTLYNAVLLAELEVTMRYNHSMSVSYVDPSADAAISESAGKDFRFVNNTDTPIYIEGYVKNKKITFNIYGKETRSADRKVSYVSEILETTPPSEQINADTSKPLGYISVGGSPHTGYKARLWKVVTENGIEVSREKVNSSNYRMSPRIATVGVVTEDPNAYNEIMAAIGTGSIDHVKDVIALLIPPAPAENAGQ